MVLSFTLQFASIKHMIDTDGRPTVTNLRLRDVDFVCRTTELLTLTMLISMN